MNFSAELGQEVLTSKKCFGKPEIYRMMIGPWIGNGLILNTGKRWFRLRRMVTTTFHFEVLSKYSEVFRDKSVAFCQVLEEKVGEDFDMARYCYRFTFDSVLGMVRLDDDRETCESDLKYIYRNCVRS